MSTGRKGFTLIELVLFSAVFTLTAVSFVTILLAMTRVQIRQSAAAEVNQQSQFILQTIQRYVEQSSVVEVPADVATTTLKLRMASSSYDPTIIYLSGNALWLQEGSGAAQQLTSNRITLSHFSFLKRENPGGHDSVSVMFTANYAAPASQITFAQSLAISVARVAAATFDSNVVPSAANTYKLGVSAGDWQSINGTIYFNGANVGVGASSPNAKLQVNSGDIYVDTVGKGLIQRSADGTCWRLAVSNAGSLSAATTTCP